MKTSSNSVATNVSFIFENKLITLIGWISKSKQISFPWSWPLFIIFIKKQTWKHRGANLSWIFFRERSSMKLLYMINQIFCKLHAKLNFGIFCYSLRWLKKVSTFCLKVIFFVAIASKNKNKLIANWQIEMTRAQLFVSK